jgi:PAS domain S-box-containing protein
MTLQTSLLIGSSIAVLLMLLALWLTRRELARRDQVEAQLNRFFSLSLDFLVISSADGYFRRVSPAVTDILGWSVAEFMARPFLDFVHPEDHAATLLEVERQVLRGEKVMKFENRYLHKDGSWRILSWRSAPQPDGLMYATARDVTDAKLIEAALQQANEQLELRVRERTAALAKSERRFRALIENGSDSIALIDGNNRIQYLSPAVTAVEGYTPEELLGRSGLEHTHPDDLPLVDEIVQKLLANPGTPTPVLWRRRHKAGHWIWLEGTATNLLDDDAVQAIVTNYRDVTQRQEFEVKLHTQLASLALLSRITRAISERQDIHSIFQVVVRTLEEQMPLDLAGICLYDAAANSLTVNSVGLHTRVPVVEIALTERARISIDAGGLSRCVQGHLIYEPDTSSAAGSFSQSLARAGLRSLVAAPLRSENILFGILFAARLPAQGFSSDECEFLRQLCEHVGLAASQAQLYTSLQTAYEDLRRTQQAVMQQERLRVLGQMASGIAHDINNAISPVSLYTEVLLEKEPELSERARAYLRTIQQAIADVAETVARMREFYRQRESPAALAPVSINTLIRQVEELTRARWFDMPHQRGIMIDCRVELAENPPVFMGVESELREALTNLIFNAVDAMPQGGTLTLRTVVTEQQQVHVEVSDTGIGMDEQTRRRCLELFFTTKGERGTGLGLAMVYGTIQRHNAELEIDSTPGLGTRVRMTFSTSASSPAEQPRIIEQLPAGMRILIVDDDPILLKSLQDILESEGCIVTAANGGPQGLDMFMAQQDALDLVITDLGMPFLDGRSLAAAIKRVSAAIPVVMLTGWGQRLINESDTPDNVDRVLSKPPRLRDLRAALAEFLPR